MDKYGVFEEKKEDLIEQFEELSTELKDHLETLESSVSRVEEESGEFKQDLESNLDSLAESVTSALAARFADEIMEELTGSAAGLTEAFSVLDSTGGEMTELLEGNVGEIVDQVSEVTDLIEQVEPVLKTAKALLG